MFKKKWKNKVDENQNPHASSSSSTLAKPRYCDAYDILCKNQERENMGLPLRKKDSKFPGLARI